MTPRRFPGPWRVDITEGSQFVIKDANGFALAYVYARNDAALHDKYLTPAEALTMAEAISKVPSMIFRQAPRTL